MKMTVAFDYPNLVQVARSFGFRLGTGMYEITPLEDNEKGFNHDSGSQLVLNKATGAWEHANIDGTKVSNGKDSKSLQKFLEKTYGFEFHVGDKVQWLHHNDPVPSGTSNADIIKRYGGRWVIGEITRIQNKSEGYGAIKYKVAHILVRRGKQAGTWQIATHQLELFSRPKNKLKSAKQLMSLL